jgi:hypothetical protein
MAIEAAAETLEPFRKYPSRVADLHLDRKPRMVRHC